MFDIGFSELCMIGLVSLLVIGPERLPKVARLAGFWLGKARHTVAKVKAEIREQLEADELRQSLDQQSAIEELARLKKDAESVTQSLRTPIESAIAASKDSPPFDPKV